MTTPRIPVILGLLLLGAASAVAQAPDTTIAQALFERRLPLVSSDGRWVVVAYQTEDGARGEDNFYVEVRRVQNDARVLWVEVVSPDERAEETADDASARLEALGTFISAYEWSAMEPMGHALTGEPDEPGVARAWVGGERPLELLVGDAQFVISGVNPWRSAVGGRPWRSAPVTVSICVGENEPSLAAAWVSPSRDVVLARVSFSGSDSCWEPDSEYHALSAGPPLDRVTCEQRGGACREGCDPQWRSTGAEGCFDSTCCVPPTRPVRCDQLAGAVCAERCAEGSSEAPQAFCIEGVCCGSEL